MRKTIIFLMIFSMCGLFMTVYAGLIYAKEVKLRFNTQQPEIIYDMEHAAKPWMKKIEEGTNGEVKFEAYYGQTLSKGMESWDATRSGIADVSWVFHGYKPGMTTLADVITLPFMDFKGPAQSSGILWKLYEEFPNVAAQFKDNKILFLWASVPFFIINNKKEVKIYEDLKGLKLRVAGGPPTEAAKMFGISPIIVGMPDSYLNLQKGVIDGMTATWDILAGFKQYEVVKYYTYVPFYTIYFSMAMNWNSWNRLSPGAQKVFTDLGGLKGSIFYGTNFFSGYMDQVSLVNEQFAQSIKDKGYEMVEYTVPPDELKRWIDFAGKPLYKKWVEDRGKDGYPEAQKILDRTFELIETYHPTGIGM